MPDPALPGTAHVLYDRYQTCSFALAGLGAISAEPGDLGETITAEVENCVRRILGEVGAAEETLLAALPRGQAVPARRFLKVRHARLRLSAEALVSAAWTRDLAALRRHLLHLETLTRAMWVVMCHRMPGTSKPCSAEAGWQVTSGN